MNEIKPNLFIVGAAKSGTTSLYSYLSEHKDIFGSLQKEPRYLTKDNLLKLPISKEKVKGMKLTKDEYLNLYKKAGNKKYIIDGSVFTMFFEEAIKNIKKLSEDYKVIVLLRNPTSRFISHYKVDYNMGDTKKDIDKFIKIPITGMGINCLELGLYSRQISNLFNILGEDRVKVIIFEEFKKDLEGALLSVYDFLEIDKQLPSNIKKVYNKNYGIAKNWFIKKMLINNKLIKYIKRVFLKTKIGNLKIYLDKVVYRDLKISKKTYDFLNNYYFEDILKLEKIINKDLSEWKNK